PGIGQEWLPRFPEDLHQLARAVRESSAALVVIDPLPAFFGPDVSANTDQSVRLALTPLATLAAETGACVLLVRHLRKAGGASAPLRAGLRTRERAADFLRELLAGGAQRAPDVEKAARAAGIPDRTLRRVKATLGVVSEAAKHDGKVEWWWRDPSADRARQA